MSWDHSWDGNARRGRDERGHSDIREAHACKEHTQKIRATLRDPDQWDDIIAAAENKAAAMDLAQLARRGELQVESQRQIRPVEPEGPEPPGYGRGGTGDDRQSMRRDFDWETRRSRWADAEPGIEPDLW